MVIFQQAMFDSHSYSHKSDQISIKIAIAF